MKLRIILLFCILTISFTSISFGNAQQTDIITIFEPIVETWNLVRLGTLANPYILNITKSFDTVTKMNWILNFDDNSMDWNGFAAGSALTNGIYIAYSELGNMIDSAYNITTNNNIKNLAYNADYQEDDKNPIGNVVWVQHLLTSFIPVGIKIDDSHSIQVYIQDDLTNVGYAIVSFEVTLKGYKRVQQIVNNPQPDRIDPLDWFFSNFWGPNGPNIINLGILTIPIVIAIVFFKRKM